MKAISTTMTEKNNQRDNTNTEKKHKEKEDIKFNRDNSSRVSTNKSFKYQTKRKEIK